MKNSEEILKTAPFKKLLLNLCVPTIVIMLVMVIYNMADIYFIGQTGNPYMIAAISLCAPFFSILSGLGTLLGSGGCTAISLALGKKEQEKIKSYTSLCFYGVLVIGILFAVLVALNLTAVCRLIGAEESTLEYAKGYLRIIALGAPIILFTNVFTNLIRADGAAKESMIANGIGTIVNIILDPIFIMGLNLGVEGAAVATVIGNAASAVYLIYYITKKQPFFSFHREDFSLRKEILIPVVTLGLPLAFSTILMSCSGMISNHLMISYGSIAVAAQGVAGKIGMLISMTAMGICMGMQPAISYNFASGDYSRMRQIVKRTGITTVIVGSVLSLLCLVSKDQILKAFIDNSEVVRYGQIMVYASIVMGPFYGLYQLCTTFLQSTGKAFYATFVALLDKGLIFIPVLFLLNKAFGMNGIVFSSAVADLLSILVGGALSLGWNKKAAGLPVVQVNQ